MIATVKINKENFRKEIISFFEKSMKISDGKKMVMKQMKTDEYDNSISVSNVRLLYTSNENYNGGKKNNGGKGWYLSNGHDQIKLN